MQIQPVVKFRGIRPSAEIEAEVRRRIALLTTVRAGIVGCRVMVALTDRHHQTGRRFDIRIDLTVPRGHLTVSHTASPRAAARELEQPAYRKRDELDDRQRRHALVAVREAFDIARRRLREFTRQQRGVHAKLFVEV